MKHTRLAILALFLIHGLISNAQAPALIPYQAVARDGAGQPLINSTLNARFTLRQGSALGAVLWQELQTVSTNSLGLFSSQLGSAVSLATVTWANGAKFLQVEIDLGSGYLEIG